MSGLDDIQAKRARDVAYWKARGAMTNDEILNEFCDARRKDALGTAVGIQEAIDSENATQAYIKEHGTDEG